MCVGLVGAPSQCNDTKSTNTQPLHTLETAQMTSLEFERPIGARADVAELKYITALHQTCRELRAAGSIHASDISALLASKFGLAISDEEVQRVILGGLSTGSRQPTELDGTCNQVLDLCELVAALIIPELLSASQQDDTGEDLGEESPHDMFQRVLQLIKRRSFELEPNADVVINVETVKQMLIALGEDELASDGCLIHEMVKQAVGGDSDTPKTFSVPFFVNALISDVLLANQHEDAHFHGIDELENRQSTVSKFFGGTRQVEAIENNFRVKGEGADVENGVVENDKEEENASSSIDEAQANDSRSTAKRIFEAPSIDYFVDSQALRSVAVCLWVFLLSHILASGFFGMEDFPSLVPSDVCSSDDTGTIGCDVIEAVLSWIDTILTIILVGGVVIMCIGGLGNKVNASRIAIAISLLPILYFLIKPFTEIGTAPADYSGEAHRQFALALSMVIAIVIVSERLRQIFYLSAKPQRWLNSGSKLARMLARGLKGTNDERSQAASYKVKRLLENALDIAASGETKRKVRQDGDVSALADYYEDRDRLEKVGGYVWMFKKMKDGSLYRQEGVRFSARLLAANIMQYFIIIYIILFVMVTTERMIESYEGNIVIILVRSAQSTATSMIDSINDLRGTASAMLATWMTSVLPAIEALRMDACEAVAGSGADIPEICASNYTLLTDLHRQSAAFKALVITSLSQEMSPAQSFLRSAIDAAADTLADAAVVVDPLEPWMIQMAMGIGGLVAFVASIFIATLYLPSVAATILRFRCGALPSLDADPKRFNLYRSKLHHTTFLTGALFWGTVLYVAILAFIIAFIILAIIWLSRVLPAFDISKGGPVWGTIIGSVVTFLVQFTLFNLCTCATYNAFYRRRPGWANLYHVLWECAWIALSILFVVLRAVKLTIVAALQIGRIDVPFLAEGVGEIGGLQLDRFPTIFRQDILVHEAHNHPYIERLGMLYIMKIRHGNDFASDAGACWRLVFVLTLFPWLRQYRTKARNEPQLSEDTSCKLGCSAFVDCFD